MPAGLTIFVAQYLVYLDGLAALGLLLFLLFRRSHAEIVRWAVALVLVAVLAYIFAIIGGAVYTDPRPFTQDHVKPLIAHAADNGFPSDHALLAAVIVAAVFLASPLWALPFVTLAVLIDWARVGGGLHHVGDVLGSSAFVLAALVIALVAAPALTRRLLPLIPASWIREDTRSPETIGPFL